MAVVHLISTFICFLICLLPIMWFHFVSLLQPDTPSHVVHFLWSQKNSCIIETWNVLLWKWKLECSHTGFYSLVKYRSPKFSSKVRIFLHVIFEIFYNIFWNTFPGNKIAWNTSDSPLKIYIYFQWPQWRKSLP